MNEKFKEFYRQVGEDKNCTILDVLQEDGMISVNKSVNPEYKAVIEIHNCISNPFYFLDKLSILQAGEGDLAGYVPMPINLSGFMAVKMINGRKNNIILDAPINTNTDKLILGYVLYKILFSDEYVIINSSELGASYYINNIKDLYQNMPNYLKIKGIETVLEHIVFDVYEEEQYDELDMEIGLIVYIDSKSCPPSKFLLRQNIIVPTIIVNDGGDSRNIKYRFNKDHNGYNFKIINYDVKMLGLSNEWIEKQHESIISEGGSIKDFMKKVFLMYDDLNDEEAQKLEDDWK